MTENLMFLYRRHQAIALLDETLYAMIDHGHCSIKRLKSYHIQLITYDSNLSASERLVCPRVSLNNKCSTGHDIRGLPKN